MDEIIYSNVQSKGLFYVVCVARTSLASRVVAGSNYEVVDWTDTVVAMPYVVRINIVARYWVVDIVSGSYSTEAEAQAWIDVNGNGGIGSIGCVESGTEV